MSQQTEIGTLVVIVLKAQHLHQPSFYKQDPYAQVSLSGQKKQTKVDPKGGQHPVWDDELRFPVLADVGKDKANRILKISCYKKEQRGEDVLLGEGTVDIEETLKNGEFDDWVQLETSAGARGEVYLEMTFYANSPPPLTRRPSKFTPTDRLARPAAYLSSSKSTSPTVSVQPRCSPVSGERRPSQPPPISSQIPSSLIPAHGPRSQAARQAPMNGGSTSVPPKRKDDSLPPLPVNSDPADGSEKNLKLPAALHPGVHSGPRPIPPQNRNRVMSVGHPVLEMFYDYSHRTSSNTPTPHPVLPPLFSQSQTPAQAYTPESISTIESRAGLTPSIIVEPVEDHSSLAFPVPFASSSSPIQEYEHRNISGVYNSLTYGPPGQVYDHLPPQVSPPSTSPPSLPQQYAEDPSPMAQLLFPYSRPHSAQPQQQQPPQYPPQPLPPLQQSFLPPPQYLPSQQQYHPQRIPYTQNPHAPQVLEQHPELPPSDQLATTVQQYPLSHSQPFQRPQQPYFAPPPPPPPPPPPSIQSQTPHPVTSQISHQPHSYFSPPPPPPPPLHSQGTRGPSILASVAQPSQVLASQSGPSQGPISPPTYSTQSVVPITHSPAIPNTTPTTDAVTEHAGVTRGENVTGVVAYAKVGTALREGKGKTGKDAAGNQTIPEQEKKDIGEGQGQPEQLVNTGQQGLFEESERQKRMEEEDRQQREEELQRQEEERRRREEQEQRRQEEEERRWEEYERGKNEERKRREEEERRRQEEEERKKRGEEERKRQEEAHRKQEEERIRRERDEAERRRKAAEEAEAERRWQEELARIRARAEQEAADAAFVRAQMEEEETERRRLEEANLALVRKAQEEAEREERLAEDRKRQEVVDMEVARREQAHEEELERRRQEGRRKRLEEVDRELARRLDIELNVRLGSSSNSGDHSRQRRTTGH